MPQTMRQPPLSTPVQSLDAIRPTMAKAVHPHGQPVGSVVKQALQDHYGSLKACAISLRYDQSQLTRELDQSKFAVLERCDGEAKAFVSKRLYAEYGQDDPKARVRRLITEGRRVLDELAEAL